jgi:predicted transcriptional regulator of viral defense system
MNITEIWRKLVLDDAIIVSSEDLEELAISAGHRPVRAINYLKSHGYIDGVLKGTYYVRSPREVELGYTSRPSLEIVAMALETLGVERWYFGLETALKLNGLTHEYFDVTYVITDSIRTTRTVSALDLRLRCIRWKPALLSFGIQEKGALRFSDPERTLLDLAYRASYSGADPVETWRQAEEYNVELDSVKLRKYLRSYPKRLQKVIVWEI